MATARILEKLDAVNVNNDIVDRQESDFEKLPADCILHSLDYAGAAGAVNTLVVSKRFRKNLNNISLLFFIYRAELDRIEAKIKENGEKLSIITEYKNVASLNPYTTDMNSLIASMVAAQVDPFERDSKGRTIWHYAAWCNATFVLKQMLRFEETELLQIKDYAETTLLHFAARGGAIDCSDLLKANVEKITDRQTWLTKNQRVLIYCAVQSGSVVMLKHVLGSHAVLKENLPLLLYYAALSGSMEMLEYVLQLDIFNPLEKDQDERGLLWYAIQSRSVKMVERVLTTLVGVGSLHAVDKNNATLLHQAASLGCIEMFDYIYALPGMDRLALAKDMDNKSLLHYAVESGSIELCERVLEILLKLSNENIHPFVTTTSGKTLLYFAVKSGSVEMFDHVLALETRYRIITPVADNLGVGLLHHAALQGSIEMFDRVKEFPQDRVLSLVDQQDILRRNLLHFAASSGSVAMLKHAVEWIEDPEARSRLLSSRDLTDRTVLHYAIESGSVEAVLYLHYAGRQQWFNMDYESIIQLYIANPLINNRNEMELILLRCRLDLIPASTYSDNQKFKFVFRALLLTSWMLPLMLMAVPALPFLIAAAVSIAASFAVACFYTKKERDAILPNERISSISHFFKNIFIYPKGPSLFKGYKYDFTPTLPVERPGLRPAQAAV